MPSVLPGWDVRLLTGHVLMIFRGLLSGWARRSTSRRWRCTTTWRATGRTPS